MITKILNKLSGHIKQFNKETNSDLKIILKGSVVFWLQQQAKENMPADLDVVLWSTSYETKLAFLQFLQTNEKIEIIKNDGNLFIFNLDSLTIEIILLEQLNLKFTTSSHWDGILLLKGKWLFTQKLLALPYIMSDYFPHDRDKKIRRTIEQLSKWKIVINVSELFNNETLDFLKHCLWNSFFIFYKYNYTEMLIFDYGKKDFYKNLTKDSEIVKIIVKFYEFFAHDQKIQRIVKIGEKILKNKEFINNFLLNNYYIPSLPGTEVNFLNKVFGIEKKNFKGFHLKENNTKEKKLFISHSDEAGGLLVGNNVYNLGTHNWISGEYDLYNLDGEYVKQVNGTAITSEVYSKEYKSKTASKQLEIDYDNYDNQILQVVSSQKPEFNDCYFITRNHDNRINALLLSLVEDSKISNLNYLITTREEVQLQSSKLKEVKDIICAKDYIYNLEVSKHQNWDNENLLIRVADFYTGINPKMLQHISKIFNQYALPFQYYFGAGSTDQTEFQFENSMTIAIPANEIHSYSSKIFHKNIFYMLFAIGILNEEFS